MKEDLARAIKIEPSYFIPREKLVWRKWKRIWSRDKLEK